MRKEVEEKLNRVRKVMKEKNLTGMLLTLTENVFWLSGGANTFVDKGTRQAASKLYITTDKQYVVCNSSEMYRIMEEEVPEGEFELIHYLWHEDEETVLEPYMKGKIGSDNGIYGTVDCGIEIQRQRYVLTEDEIARYRVIGLESANLLEESCKKIQKGETEYEVAARTVGMLMAKGYQVPVCLVAADDRLNKYRHPIPTEHKVEKYVMVAICAQKYGLTVSITRMISFGQPDEDKAKRMSSVAKVDAAYILNTKPGVETEYVLQQGKAVYAAEGYGHDFHLHHQGGALGYLTRDYCTNFSNSEKVLNKQAFSWNPTIAGVKAEDTFLVMDDIQEVISHTGNWTYEEVTINGQKILRPVIWVK